MALANAVQNARHTAQVITWQDGEGDPLNLVGATLSGRIRDLSTLATRNIDGTLTVTDGGAGVFQWSYGAADVATAGEFLVQFVATFGAAGDDKTLAEPWTVEAAL